MNCENCKHWKKMKHRDGYGNCNSKHWNVHPNYYEYSDKPTKFDMVEVTYSPIMGKHFGCIDFKAVNELINNK